MTSETSASNRQDSFACFASLREDPQWRRRVSRKGGKHAKARSIQNLTHLQQVLRCKVFGPSKTRNFITAAILTCLLVASLTGSVSHASAGLSATSAIRTVSSFDTNWLFTKGDAAGAEQPGFADDGWRKLDVPHDWSIEGPFDEKNPTGGAGGFLPAGVGWYRKHFNLPEAYTNRRVFIDFDGVMANSDDQGKAICGPDNTRGVRSGAQKWFD